MSALPFKFECPVTFFEKASAPPGQQRRIAGIISTENRDRQKEIVIQKGLDFSDFVNHGYYNDNHSKETTGIVGHPADEVKLFKKGQRLPDGTIAKSNCSWAEGFLFPDHDRADKIWKLGHALAKAGGQRKLGFSIEGGIEKRIGPGRKTIAKAKVRNVAITNCPVNTDTRLEVIAKGLMAVDQMEDDMLTRLAKGMTMGTPTSPGDPPSGPRTGEGAGQVVTPESLERKPKRQLDLTEEMEDEAKKKQKKKLSKAEALARIQKRFSNAKARTLARIYQTTVALKQRGQL